MAAELSIPIVPLGGRRGALMLIVYYQEWTLAPVRLLAGT
jgi:hypothetical protein